MHTPRRHPRLHRVGDPRDDPARHLSTRLSTWPRASRTFPPAPTCSRTARSRQFRDNINQYAITWGSKRLRDALAKKYDEWYRNAGRPETDITVTCGATEAMVSALMAIVDPGDEVIVFEPFYENYGPDAVLCGASPVYSRSPQTGTLDLDRLAAAFSKKTRAIVVNTPTTLGPRADGARAGGDRRAVPEATMRGP